MSREIVRDIVNLERAVSQINDEIPDAGLTLTRTAVQAITTAGTTIVWQSRIRGQGISWSGSNITIPATGWYHISVALRTSAALNDLLYRLSVNGVNVQFASGIGDVDRVQSSVNFMRYFTRGDIVLVSVIPSVNVNIDVIAENALQESPILNIAQLSNEAEV
jgi:hypothetical protein